MAAGTPPFAVGIPPAAADTPPSGGSGLDRPPSSTCPAAPSARRGTALSRPHRPRRSISSHRRLRTGAASFVFRFMAAEHRLGEGHPPGLVRPGTRRADRPSALPSRGAARATQRVRLDRQVRCKRTFTGVRAHSGGGTGSSTAGGAGRPSPKRRKCAMNPNANEKQGAGGLQSTPGDAVSWRPCLWERVRATGSGRDGPHEPATRGGGLALGQHAVRHGAAAPHLDSTPFATERRPRTWTERRSSQGGPPRPRNGSA